MSVRFFAALVAISFSGPSQTDKASDSAGYRLAEIYQVQAVHCLLRGNEAPFFISLYIREFQTREDAFKADMIERDYCAGTAVVEYYDTGGISVPIGKYVIRTWTDPDELDWDAPTRDTERAT